jgi:hypothetical protein
MTRVAAAQRQRDECVVVSTAICTASGDFAPALDDPAAMVAALGYRQRAMWSIVGSAAEAGALHVPRWLLNSLLRTLRDGYRVHAFEAMPAGV